MITAHGAMQSNASAIPQPLWTTPALREIDPAPYLTEIAVCVAETGIPVFPCGAEKTPLTEHGFKDATRDPKTIRRAFSHPAAKLIGVPTGATTGIDVLDLDPGHGSDAWRTANIHRMSETRIHRTARGGEHWLFRHVQGVRNLQDSETIGLGCDIRGEGGYAIWPGSPGYTVVSDADVADWPDWLLPLALKPEKPAARPTFTPKRVVDQLEERRYRGLIQSLLANVSNAPEGAKHGALLKNARALGGVLQATGTSEDDAVAWLIAALPSTVRSWEGARKTAIDGLRHGAAEPIELEDRRRPVISHRRDVSPPDSDPHDTQAQAAEPETFFDPWAELAPPRFPTDALPPVLRAFSEDRARIIGADPCAIAWAAISAASAALDGSIRLRMKRHDHWSVPPAIWVALIGRPSTKKSPIIDAAWEPLHRAQKIDLDQWRQEVAIWKATSKKERSEDEPTPRRRLVSHDGTMEALQDILGRQNRGIGVLRDELSGWLGSLEKYAGAKGSGADRAFFLQAWNGGPNVIDRVSRGTIPINELLVAICGGIQPDRLRQFHDLTDDGLWQRFIPIIVAPASRGLDEVPPRCRRLRESHQPHPRGARRNSSKPIGTRSRCPRRDREARIRPGARRGTGCALFELLREARRHVGSPLPRAELPGPVGRRSFHRLTRDR